MMITRSVPAEWTLTLDGNTPVPVAEMTTTGPEVEYIRSETAVLPDPDWSATDEHGHQHRWTSTDRRAVGNSEALPTLVPNSEHVECDSSCGDTCGGEGYDITVWHCATCGDRVDPGYIPDREARTTGIPITVGPAQITLATTRTPLPGEGDLPAGADPRPAVLLRGASVRMAGRAWMGNPEWSSDGSRFEVHFTPDP